MQQNYFTRKSAFFKGVVLFFTLTTVSAQDSSEQYWLFDSAHQAVRAKEWGSFLSLEAQLRDHPLYYFLRYHYLKAHLEETPTFQVREFINQYGKTAFGDALRPDWLYLLAKQRDWTTFLQVYTPQKSTDLQCFYAQARLDTGQATQEALQDTKNLWLVGKSQSKACDIAFDYLARSPLMNDTLIWERIGLAMDKGQTQLANTLAKRLSPDRQGWMERWQFMHKNPQAALETFDVVDTPLAGDIVAHGIKRLAKSDFGLAKSYWFRYQGRFSPQQKSAVQRQLAFASIEQNHPEAVSWLTTLSAADVDDKLGDQRLIFALNRSDWRAVASFTAIQPANKEDALRWQYWQARALEQTGKVAEAKRLYQELAKERDYYGFLAANRIGASYSLKDQPITFTPAEKDQLMANFGIKAAYKFYQLGLLVEGRQEWNYTTQQLPQRQQAVAAAVAHQWQWHDRAMTTAAKAEIYDDVGLRFPLPYRANFTAGASAQGIDLAWVYGIARQESLFMTDARSRSGALGLMQLMPATGKMVARKVGLTISDNQTILDIDTNISLGTTYLRQMLDTFNGNYMLATAAYNAGPGRAKRWAGERTCVDADVWVELIPFSETKTYVRRVLFNTAVFETRLGFPQRPIRIALPSNASCPVYQANN